MVGKIGELESTLETESSRRESTDRELTGQLIEAKDAIESCVAEWREGIDAAETRWDKQLQQAVGQLEANALEMQDKMRQDMEVLTLEQQRIESSLKKRLDDGLSHAEEKISENGNGLMELRVRMEAVEQLLDEQASKLEAGLEEGKADTGVKVLALQEETAEHLSGFRDFLDTELNGIQDETEKTREELTEVIAKNRGELKEDILEQQSAQLSELESRVLAAGAAAMAALREELAGMRKEAAEESAKRAEEGIAKVEEMTSEMKDSMMSMRIRNTASEERAMRVQKETQDGVAEIASNLEAISIQMQEFPDLRKKVTAAEAELEAFKIKMSNLPVKQHKASAPGAVSAVVASSGPLGPQTLPLSGELSEELGEELSALLTKLSRRVDAWEDKLLEYQHAHRTSATRLQERVQRCHGKFDEAKAAVVKLEDDTHQIHTQMDAANERLKTHEERMASADERADREDKRLTVDEGRIEMLESADADKEEQLGNLAKRSAQLEEGVTKVHEAVTQGEIETGLLSDNLSDSKDQLSSVEARLRAHEDTTGTKLVEMQDDSRARLLELDERVVEKVQEIDAKYGERVQEIDTKCHRQLLEIDQKIEKNGQDDIGHQIMLQGLCDKNMTRADGLEKDIARLETYIQETTGLGPKVTQLSIRVDHLDRQMQEDIGAHQRRFDDGTALARQTVDSKRRESKEKLEQRVRRKSERLAGGAPAPQPEEEEDLG